LLTKNDWNFIVVENGLNVGLTPDIYHPTEAIDEYLDSLGEWTYPGDQDEDDYPEFILFEAPNMQESQ
jgi:hypothetical protein